MALFGYEYYIAGEEGITYKLMVPERMDTIEGKCVTLKVSKDYDSCGMRDYSETYDLTAEEALQFERSLIQGYKDGKLYECRVRKCFELDYYDSYYSDPGEFWTIEDRFYELGMDNVTEFIHPEFFFEGSSREVFEGYIYDCYYLEYDLDKYINPELEIDKYCREFDFDYSKEGLSLLELELKGRLKSAEEVRGCLRNDLEREFLYRYSEILDEIEEKKEDLKRQYELDLTQLQFKEGSFKSEYERLSRKYD